MKCLQVTDSRAVVPSFFGTPVSWKTVFPRTGVWEGWFRVFKCLIFILYFVSVIVTSAPPWVIRHQIPEAGDPALES